MLLGALILICSVMFALWSWIKPRHHLTPPTYPGALPVIGHAIMLLRNATDFWILEKKLYDYCVKNEDIIEIRFGPQSLYIITDPDDSLTISEKCLDKPYFYFFGKEMYGRGLVTANGTTFGLNTAENSTTLKTYARATEDLFMLLLIRSQRLWLQFKYIFNWSSCRKQQDRLMRILKDITKTVIANYKSNLRAMDSSDEFKETSSEKFKPLLVQLLDLADKDDALTEEEVREHLDTIIGAAYDTSATTLTFTILYIGSHPIVQERIYKELQDVLGDQERDLNRHDLPKLVYLEAVIKETLRVCPTVPRYGRTSSTDVQLKKYVLPANSTYLISVYGLNHHSSWGADVDQFRPERWLDPATLPDNPNVYASFCLGKRNCIGKLYAMMAIKTTLAYILKRYRIKSDIGKLVTRCDILLKPVAGHEISLELRT